MCNFGCLCLSGSATEVMYFQIKAVYKLFFSEKCVENSLSGTGVARVTLRESFNLQTRVNYTDDHLIFNSFPPVILPNETLLALFILFPGSCEGGKGVTCESYHPEKGILNGNETCDTAEYSCFVLWKDNVNERNETFYIVLKKGCFQVSVNEAFRDCKDDCIQNPNYDAFRSHNVSGFCCCNIHMCNRNFTPVYYTESTTTTATTDMSTGEQIHMYQYYRVDNLNWPTERPVKADVLL